MSNFDKVLPLVLKNEGVVESNPTGYADIPGDTGGVTKWGISTKAWNWIREDDLFFERFPEKVTDLTQDRAKTIYQRKYWFPWFEELDATTAFLLFDCQVNQGYAIKIAQRAIGVEDDGSWGPKSEASLRLAKRNVPELNNEIIWQRTMRYREISVSNEVNQKFLVKLWIPRLNACRKMMKNL